MQENKIEEIEIDLKDILFVLLRKSWLILLVTILTTVVAFLLTTYSMKPYYVSDTKVYVLNKQSESSLTYQDLQIGSQLAKDYKELIVSRPVLQEVISKLSLNMDYSTLKNMIDVEILTDTRIISISVQAYDPDLSMNIANAIREEASEQITQVMDIESVNIVEEAILPSLPAGPHLLKNLIIGGAFGAFLTIGIIIVIYLMNDTIRNPEDIEKRLELSTLATIPIINMKNNKRKEKVRKIKKRRRK